MKRITGTHVYSYLRCPRAVALDLHEDPALRRQPTPWEEHLLARGRSVEAAHVAKLLGYVEPVYPRRDFGLGAEATLSLLRAGVDGVVQGVLYREERLGIPDLLRRLPGKSGLGEHHYEVLDIKSSRRSRSDQLLQVAFYSRLLGEVQGRTPEFASLILKDGREERFRFAEFEPTLEEVESEVRKILEDPNVARPFLSPACSRCRWSELCLAQLEEADDLSMLQGMTRGVRTLLERHGLGTCASLRELRVEPTSRRTHIPSPQLRRFKRAAESRAGGRPLVEGSCEVGPAALLHFLTDPFEERVLYMGMLHPALVEGRLESATPQSLDAELPAFEALVGELPSDVALLHYGPTVPRWYEERARGGPEPLRGRFVDLARLLRGAAVYPGPVFGLSDQVRLGLGMDPDRDGHTDAAAYWGATPEGPSWLAHKGASDLGDLARLKAGILTGESVHGPRD